MELKNFIYTALMSLCIFYVFILTFKSSRNIAMRAQNIISEKEYLAKRKDITKKLFISTIVLVTLSIACRL